MKRFVHAGLLTALCVLFSSSLVFAQTTSATISGRITDPQGAVVRDAVVEAVNVNTGVSVQTKSNAAGIYVVNGLIPGRYRVTVTKEGFGAVNLTGLDLNLQDQVSRNFELKIGSVNESVTVEANGLNINTTDASVSTVVDQTYVKNMPLNGRSFQDLILLTPGVVTQTPQNNGTLLGNGEMGEFSVNGQRPEENYYTVDGVSANTGTDSFAGGAGPSGSIASSTALGTTQSLVSVDELQEFRVQSSTYSAEFGRNPGGQFAFETKSGTNQWHGTAYDYLRNDYFDATDYFTNYFRPLVPSLKKPAVRQNDFGGTLGGPLRIPGLYNGKDKTFFFFSYEGLRLRSPQPTGVYAVPDINLRANAPAPLNQALDAFARPNGQEIGCNPSDPRCPPNGQSGMAQFIGGFSNPSSLDSTSIRFDHIVKEKTRLFFRFSDTPSGASSHGSAGSGFTLTNFSTTAGSVRTYTAGATTAISGRVANDFRLNYTSNELADNTVIDRIAGSTPVNLGQLSGTGADSAASLQLFLPGSFAILEQAHGSGLQRQWNTVDTVSLAFGRHQLKFGVDYRRLTPILTPIPTLINYQFLSPAQVLANTTQATSYFASATNYPLYKNFSAFAEDEWKATQRLNLSLGLRWELNPAPGVTKGLMPYAIQGTNPNNWVAAPQGTPLWRTTWYNFAPRIGAAYTLRDQQGWETVIRGGGGVFFDTAQQLGSAGFAEGPGFFGSSGVGGGSFPTPPPTPLIQNPPDPNACSSNNGCISLYGFAQHLQLPYTTQWNLSFEQALGRARSLTASYVGSHAARLLQQNEYFPQSNPQSNDIKFVQNGLTSDFNSAEVQFKQRLNQGLTSLISYTWSHCIDYGSQNYIVGYQRGNCDYDVRHNFSAAFSYDVPSVGHGRILSAFLDHWGIDNRLSARTGFPVTLFGPLIPQPDGRLFDQGLNLTGKPIYIDGAQCNSTYAVDFGNTLPCPGGRAINPDAFNFPNCPPSNPSCYGNAPRNFARGFGAWQMNLAVRREFPIHERIKLQFRAEAFNVFNHTSFGFIDPFLGDSTFGQATSTLAHSWDFGSVLSSLYQMGGARSAQFALKVVF